MFTLKALAIILTGVVAAGAAVGNALWGRRAKARRRLRRGTAALADREVVTLVGTVRKAGELLEAPLSGRSCVLYEAYAHVKELQAGHRYADGVAEICEHGMVPFELDIGDELVLIDGTKADVELPPTPIVPRRIEREVALFEKYEQPRKLVTTSSCEETTIVPGDRVAVQGMAIIETDANAASERGYRDDAPRKVRLVAHDAHPLTIGRPRRR